MTNHEIDALLQKQKTFFQTANPFPVSFRLDMLRILYDTIKQHEQDIVDALKTDLGKSDFESFMCEIGMVLSEISYMIRHTRSFARKKYVHTPLAQFPSRSYTLPCPHGNVLIMSPWNYPFLLTMGPLVDALAAGNTAILKPSAYSPATGKIIEQIISESFPSQYVAVVLGGREENAVLLDKKFDFIFFTGSQNVGKEVLRHTAETLTPAVLELGGKCPCIVDRSSNVQLAAKRIVFGKFINCGQTCVAPDYIICHEDLLCYFGRCLATEIFAQYGRKPLENPDYGRIINEKHFDRLLSLMPKDKVTYGGEFNRDTLQIAPTILYDVDWSDACMQEEIFGPILPIITFKEIDEIPAMLANRPKPLALYLFSDNYANIRKITSRCAFGGGCVNDTIIHLATSEMGFGGVGESGMGSYHGKAGFDAFSHTKSIVKKSTWIDLPMRYRPYKRKLYGKLLRLFLR